MSRGRQIRRFLVDAKARRIFRQLERVVRLPFDVKAICLYVKYDI
jgi:hypothetical protein